MQLVYRHILRCAIDLARTCDYDAFHTAVARSLTHVQRAAYIGVHITVRSKIAVRNGYEGGKVKHRGTVAGYRPAKIRITHIPAHNLKIADRRNILKPSVIVKGIIVTQRSHIVTLCQQQLCKVRPNEAVGSCYQYFPVHFNILFSVYNLLRFRCHLHTATP